MEVMGVCSQCTGADIQRTCSACGQNFCPECFQNHNCHGRQAPTIGPV